VPVTLPDGTETTMLASDWAAFVERLQKLGRQLGLEPD